MADILVGIDHDVALAGLDREGRDLIHETSGLLRGFGLVLAGHGKFVLHITADLPMVGNVLGGLAHVVAVERIPKAIADHRVDVAHIAHLHAGTQVGAVG